MKKIILLVLLLTSLLSLAQNTNDSINIQQQIERLKNMHAKDSAKIELLVQEIRELIAVTEDQKKADALKYSQIQDSINLAKKLDQISRYQAKTMGIPVTLYSDTLFFIHNDLAPFTAQERAEHDINIIKTLYKSTGFNADSIKIEQDQELFNIIYQGRIITSVSDIDAMWAENSQPELAEKYKIIIKDTILKYQEKNSFNSQLIRYGELALLLAILLTVFYLIHKLTAYLGVKFRQKKNILTKGITLNNYQLINRNQLSNIIDRVLWLLKIFLFIVTLFILVPFMLRLFPQTEIWVIQLNQLIKVPINSIKESILDYIPNLVKIVIILIIVKLFIRFLRFISIEIYRKRLVFPGFHPDWAKPTFSLLRFVFNIFAIIMIFPLLPGADSIAFKGVSVFLGILLSIGSSSAITNAISGLVITYMRPYRIGDWIKTKDTIGVVIEKSLLVTRLKTFNNEDITIPNSSILNDHTINYSSIGKEKGLAISVKINVRYDYKPGIIEQRLIEAALRTDKITTDIPPYVLDLSLGSVSATYELNAYTYHPENMFFIKSDLTRNIKNVFNEAKIQLTINNYFEIKSVQNLGSTN